MNFKFFGLIIIVFFIFSFVSTSVFATTYILPSSDGNAGQTLVTDGNGNVTWQYGGNVYIKLDQTDMNLYMKEWDANAVVPYTKDYTFHTIENDHSIKYLSLMYLAIMIAILMGFVTAKDVNQQV